MKNDFKYARGKSIWHYAKYINGRELCVEDLVSKHKKFDHSRYLVSGITITQNILMLHPDKIEVNSKQNKT